jgi:hypothetical protein
MRLEETGVPLRYKNIAAAANEILAAATGPDEPRVTVIVQQSIVNAGPQTGLIRSENWMKQSRVKKSQQKNNVI